MKYILSVASLFLLAFTSVKTHAQSTIIEGIIQDSSQQTLPGATIMLLQAADSILVHFAITEPNGQFKLPPTNKGKYLLQATYVGYETYFLSLQMEGDQDVLRLPPIQLQGEVADLEQVVVEADRIPIQIKKDTIVYDAKAFKTRPNAAVEDLLKKLPGVEVDREGNVKAQGERVQKVLVDGKEFFGNDPKIATKNLAADAIDKVEVFDKKSDRAEFSGIDDGQRQKTINLALKEDKKNGFFGKLSGGYGTDERYEAKGNINRFGKKLQFSALGMLNNINEAGFSINDYINFMGGLGRMMGGGSGMLRLNITSDDMSMPIDFGGNTGITNTGAIGMNFNYDFSKNTQLNSSYFYSRRNNVLDRTAFRESLVDDFSYISDENSIQNNLSNGHSLNLNFEHKFDSTQNIKLRSQFRLLDTDLQRLNNTQNFFGDQLESSTSQDYQSVGDRFNFNANLIYKKKLGKAGRVLVASANVAQVNMDAKADLFSLNSFSDAVIDTINQSQVRKNEQLDYEAKISYTEPLGKKQYLDLSFNHRNYDNESIKNFFDQRQIPSSFLPALSNHFQRDYFYNLLKLRYQRNSKKSNLNLGLGLQQSELRGEIISQEFEINRDFLFLLPSASWNYNFTSTKNIRFNYKTNIQEPSLEQLQPVVNNTDPLNIYIGNPNLKPEYQHSMSLNFMTFDQFTFTNFFTFLDVTYTQDKITNARSVDALFRQTMEPINVREDWQVSNYLSFSTPIKMIKSKVNINSNIIYHRGLQMINDLENVTDQFIGSFDLSLENRKKDMVDVVIGTKWTYNATQYSINKKLERSFTNREYYADLTLDMKKNYLLNTSFTYTLFDDNGFNDQQVVPIWTASLSKTFLKDDRGQLKLTVFDILNQNVGINRRAESNFILDERIRSLGRYAMLSFTYSLSGFNPNEDGIQITTKRR